MTREEAIKFLNEQKEFLLKGCFWEETRMNINEAFDMAIEALEADAPDTNVGDTISRQAAIDAMSEALKRVFPEHRQIAEKCLNALPSAQPEGINYVKFSEEDYEKIAEQLRKIPIVLTLSEPEIIRCKDCKHFGGGTYCYERDDMWDENDFCSYAERKEQDDG